MNLSVLYERLKELKYDKAEQVATALTADFIRKYIELKDDKWIEENPITFIKELLDLSTNLLLEDKLKKINKENDTDWKNKIISYNKNIVDSNFPKKYLNVSSLVNKTGFARNFGNIKEQKDEKYQTFAKNLKKLIEDIEQEKNAKKARDLYRTSELDFTIPYCTTNIVATIIYPLFPTAFPLTNGYVKDFFERLGLEKLRNENEKSEKYIELAEKLDAVMKDELKINDDEKHFGIIDKLAHTYDDMYADFNEDDLNVIYYGPPGTGKTYTVKEKLKFIKEYEGDIEVEQIQFHPSYTYEDFIEGIKPKGVGADGNIKFELVNGHFKKFCMEARKNLDKKYYFIVDEINRANLSAVFGETLSLLEKDYRHNPNENDDNLIETQYSPLIASLENKEKLAYHIDKNDNVKFGIPKNVYFIGMMNDVDKSIDSFDLALRRRFKWVRKDCDYEVIENNTYRKNMAYFDNIEEYVKCAKTLNEYISQTLGLGKSYEFGHSFFMKMSGIANGKEITGNNLKTLFDLYLRPTLKEYLRTLFSEQEIETKLEDALKKFTEKLKNESANNG